MNDCFVFYKSYAEALMNLPDNDSRFKVLGAVFDYVFNGTEIDSGNFTAIENMILMLMKASLDNGILKMKKRKIKYKTNRNAQIKKMYEDGATQTELAKTFNLSRRTINTICNKTV